MVFDDTDEARPVVRGLGHALWRMVPPVYRRAALSHVTAALTPFPALPEAAAAVGMVVAGEFSRASGIGAVARLMAQAASGLGTPVWRMDLAPLAGEAGELPPPEDAPAAEGAPLVVHVNAPLLPLALRRMGRTVLAGRRIVGYWAWELPSVPPGWRPGAAFAHDVWVPSRFVAAAVEPLAPGRVRVVTPPVAAAPPVPARLGRGDFGLPEGAVIVLVSFSLASSFARKNPLGAIAAFRAAFGARADRVLVLKVGHAHHALGDFARLRAAAAGAGNIRIETRILPAADSHALTNCCDIVLSLHRAEGFGLVPAEAMLLGKPVIATGWSGNLDYMDAESAALVGHRLIPVEDDRQVYRDSLWAEPDMAEAVAHLRRLASDAEARVALGGQGAQAAAARLSAASLMKGMRASGARG